MAMSNSCGRKSPTSRQPMISMITGKSHMQLWFNMINPNKGPNQKTTDMNPRRRFVASKSRRNCLGNLDKYEYTFTAFTYHIFYVVYPNQPAQFLRIIHTIRPSTISHTISISTLYLVLHCRLEQHFLHELHPPRETVSCHFSAPLVSAPFGETQTNRGNPKKVVLKSPNRAHSCQVI